MEDEVFLKIIAINEDNEVTALETSLGERN